MDPDNRPPLLLLGDGEQAAHIYLDFGHEFDIRIEGFVQDHDPSGEIRELEGLPVYPIGKVAHLAPTHRVMSAIGRGDRRGFVETIDALGFRSHSAIHRLAVISPHCKLEPGCCIYPFVGIAARAHIGRHVLVARNSVVGHGSSIGDYTTISVGCIIPGNVKVGRSCYFGVGAVTVDAVSIGDRVTIGAGAVVTKDIPDGATVIGNPARIK